MAAPITYEVDGQQYIAVLAGWGGAYPLLQGKDAGQSGNERNISRVLAFRVGATGTLPAVPPESALTLDSRPTAPTPASVNRGEALFGRFCSVCHGEAAVAGGIVPDLRRSPFLFVDAWYRIVLDGALREGGMAAFGPVLDRSQAAAIRDYVSHRAQQDGVAGGRVARQPDRKRGAEIVAKGTGSGVPACAPCHGANGDSNGNAAFPRIGGQPAAYLAEQLRDFKSKARDSAVMSTMIAALTPDDINDVAAYYADALSQFQLPTRGDAALIAKGKALAESGSPDKGVPGCNSCHGVGGGGEAPTIPYLAGQYASYTTLELQMWRQGSRRNSLEAMRLFAGKLDDPEVAALAAYYEQVRGAAVVPPAASVN
jgi:cytochrome c553